MPAPRVVYWFRTDLRLHDSPALQAALDLKPECLYPIWTWDPHYVYRARVGVNRWQFLLDCQNDLSKGITKLNGKSKLFVLREAPQTLFPKLFRSWRITHLVFEKDTDAYAKDRDREVVKIAQEAGVEVVMRSGRTLWDSDEIVKAHGGKPTMSITQVQAVGAKLGPIAKPILAPTSLPDPGDMKLDFAQEQPGQVPDVNAKYRKDEERSYDTGIAGPLGNFSVPTLEELGLKPATTPHRGGESIALAMLDTIIANEDYTATFEKPKTAPTAFEPQATTLMSPYLHFGAISVRLIYHRVEEVIKKYKGKASQPPTSLTGQLLFRDMYFAAQAALGYRFGQTYNNDHCRFVPWHLPSKIDEKTGLITGEHDINDASAEEMFVRWREGRTGFPWIDALMRQLKHEGWIHHLGRHAVACFLTRGGCYVSWERGAEVFEEWLVDHEAASNIGNWQWLSCTAFYAQFYRCYSPIAFPKKWDQEGAFVRRFVPELRSLPAKYIYEPWKAPLQDQRAAGVLIKGKGDPEHQQKEGDYALYPKPMFDFAERRDICIQGLKKAYRVGMFGNHQKVLDGTWREMFDDDAEGPTKGRKGGPGGTTAEQQADGLEEAKDDAPVTPKRGVKRGPPSPKATVSSKRAKGQETIDGAFKKMKRKGKK
ncbi:hypothetical protein LTR50_005436 [Elasticomyces elasticus]|nr:hypothetical protein LTR50_005436 [Elasticomyces elasticus]